MRRALAAVLAVVAAAGCASEPGDAAEPDGAGDADDDGFQAPPDFSGDTRGELPLDPDWTGLGRGVAYRRVTTAPGIAIAYGGYTARLSDSAAWASELVDAALGAEDVGHVYAVQGPLHADYRDKEIANTALRAHLATLPAAPIYVVAHSSGAFVAHELLGQLAAAGATAVLARIHYANLDGGGSGLTAAIAAELGGLAFVYALDPTLADGLSQNHGAARTLAARYADQGAALREVRVESTGCDSGAGWCLHDVVITERPHDPAHYDIARDYTDFVGRPVTSGYLAPWF